MIELRDLTIPMDVVTGLSVIADMRERQHNWKNSSYTAHSAAMLLGLAGEYAFMERTSLLMDLAQRKHGDGGFDYQVGDLKIDVKASSGVYGITQRTDLVSTADVYVLESLMPSDGGFVSRLIGWCKASDLKKSETTRFRPNAPLVYRIRQKELRRKFEGLSDMIQADPRPRQYAAQIMALEDKELRRAAFEEVPEHYRELVRKHCDITHQIRRARDAGICPKGVTP